MMQQAELKGIYVPVVTPFLPNEELDLESYGNYLKALLQHDIQGLVINGTTGEAPTVTWEEAAELLEVTKAWVSRLGKRIPIVLGTGTNSTAASVKRTELAARLGADAALVVTPYYNRPTEAGVYEHFRRVAEVGLPVIAYEIPGRTGISLSTDTMRRILELDGVIGLKYSSSRLDLISELVHVQAKPILCGEDRCFASMLERGAAGGMLAAANLRTDQFLQVYRLACQGDAAQAGTRFDTLIPLIDKLFQESNPSPLKWALARLGVIASDTVRLPLAPISKELERELAHTLDVSKGA